VKKQEQIIAEIKITKLLLGTIYPFIPKADPRYTTQRLCEKTLEIIETIENPLLNK